ncbi:hypothetical protein [Marisediminicola senii]|uniref:hypothetical protein n=1 Tax=Marisediminicola senii TaxID=2711233 RepID=UPI0013EBAADA|nr:hypothetical protein [Marisediminicola senii]
MSHTRTTTALLRGAAVVAAVLLLSGCTGARSVVDDAARSAQQQLGSAVDEAAIRLAATEAVQANTIAPTAVAGVAAAKAVARSDDMATEIGSACAMTVDLAQDGASADTEATFSVIATAAAGFTEGAALAADAASVATIYQAITDGSEDEVYGALAVLSFQDLYC